LKLCADDGLVDGDPVPGENLGVVLPVEVVEPARDPAHRTFFRLVYRGHRLDGDTLDVRERRVDLAGENRVVDRVVGGPELVARPVVAVHAVHDPTLRRPQLIIGQWSAIYQGVQNSDISLTLSGKRFTGFFYRFEYCLRPPVG